MGRYGDEAGADDFMHRQIMPDLIEATAQGVEYMPVVFPGFSWHNLLGGPLNEIPRNGGRFYWRQVYNAIRAHAGIRAPAMVIYGAMFDEVDEGTAMHKMAATSAELPVLYRADVGAVQLSRFGQFLLAPTLRFAQRLHPLTQRVQVIRKRRRPSLFGQQPARQANGIQRILRLSICAELLTQAGAAVQCSAPHLNQGGHDQLQAKLLRSRTLGQLPVQTGNDVSLMARQQRIQIPSPQRALGGIAIDLAQEPSVFHEPFSDTDSWILAETTVELPQDGRYFAVLYHPQAEPGKAWVALGQRETFGITDIAQLPQWLIQVRQFHEVPGQALWLNATLVTLLSLLAVGIV